MPSASLEDPHHLSRFVTAQDAGGTYDRALEELRRGQKTSHWMWFVFPQIAGLGTSPAARHFAIASLDEARAYLGHPVLGHRLLESATVLEQLEVPSAEAIFGPLDALKLRSSMTLFVLAAPEVPTFARVLDRYFGGERDPATLARC